MTKYLGRVTCDFGLQSAYVRVEVPGRSPNSIPLSVKATRNGFDRNYFTKGRNVEVERNPLDGRKFRVIKVFEALDPTKEIKRHPSTVKFDIYAESAEAFRKEHPMPSSFTGKAMSHDRVKFFLGECYYNSGCKRDAMRDVLKKAFDLGHGHSLSLMKNEYGGFWIVCRPSQFARFTIYRNEANQKNGFVDLQTVLYQPAPSRSPFDELADKSGVEIGNVMLVAAALDLSGCDVKEALINGKCREDTNLEVDVSKNKHYHGLEGRC